MNAEEIASFIMVDTLGIRIPNIDPAKLPHKYMEFGAGDERRWSKGRLKTAAGKVSLRVTAQKSTRACDIEGSVAGHHQGHNIVSSGDIAMLAFTAASDVNDGLELDLGPKRMAEFARGRGMEVTRIDTPVLLKKPSHIDTRAVINGLAMAAIAAGLNTSVYSGQSMYFDQEGQLRALKVYDKEKEMARKRMLQIPETDNTERLLKLAQDTLRLEAVFRKKWLTRHYKDDCSPSRFTPLELGLMLQELLEKYDLRRDIRRRLRQDEVMLIPPAFRPALFAWQSGYNAKQVGAGSNATFDDAQVYLWREHSLDISGPHPQELPYGFDAGELLSPSNFVHVPEEIIRDEQLFFSRDMTSLRQELDGDARQIASPPAKRIAGPALRNY